MLCGLVLSTAGGGEAHPSVIARSWYINECSSVFAGPC